MKNISIEYVKKEYLQKNLTREMIAKKAKVPVNVIDRIIRNNCLEKWRHGVVHKVHNPTPRTKEQNKTTMLSQPNRKMVEQLDKHGRVVKVYESIAQAARELGLIRQNVRDCVNPNMGRKTAGGFYFKEHKPSKTNNRKMLLNKYNYLVKKAFENDC